VDSDVALPLAELPTLPLPLLHAASVVTIAAATKVLPRRTVFVLFNALSSLRLVLGSSSRRVSV
jgi:hypothetical protein